MSILMSSNVEAAANSTSVMNESLMDRLKSATMPAHQATEELGFQQSLVRGLLPREAYVASLGQFLIIHQCLDQHLLDLRATVPTIAGVMCDRYVQVPYLEEDLAYFLADIKAIEPLNATGAMVKSITELAAANPVGLLGYLYVLEGSNNGGRMIALAVRKTYDLAPDGQGTRYLDPYGSEQRTLWKQFKEDMNSQAFTSDEKNLIVGSAHRTFVEIGRVYEELFRIYPVTIEA